MMYVIRKGGSFYRANRAGYTNHIEAAGLYTKEEAEAEARIEPDTMAALPLSDFIGELTAQQRLLDEKWLAMGLENNLITAIRVAVRVAGEAVEEWDKAPAGMKTGKLLLALAGHRPGYRSDIDAIHAVLPKEPRK